MEESIVMIERESEEAAFNELVQNRKEVRRLRREKNRKNKIVRLLSLVLVIGLLTGAFSVAINAAEARKVYTVETTEYVVRHGDTLTSIAHEYMGDFEGTLNEYIFIVCKNNEIERANEIFVGQTIEVPTYKLEPSFFY